MTPETASVDALVLAAGEGVRLGMGPKALLRLGDETLLERAITVARSAADRVIAGVPSGEAGNTPGGADDKTVVLAGGPTRLQTFLTLLRESGAAIVLVHDIVHPFVTTALARSVVAVARQKGAATAAIRANEYLYEGKDQFQRRITAGETIWQVQKPFAFQRELFLDAMEKRAGAPPQDAGALEILLDAGVPVEIVPGVPWNIKVTTPSDWALAQVIHRYASLLKNPGREHSG